MTQSCTIPFYGFRKFRCASIGALCPQIDGRVNCACNVRFCEVLLTDLRWLFQVSSGFEEAPKNDKVCSSR